MQASNFWNKLYLYSFKVILFILFLSPAISEAQYRAGDNDARFQKRKIKFGIDMGYSFADFKISRNEKFIESDSILGIYTGKGTGFNISILSSLYLHKNLELRFTPGVMLAEKSISYDMIDNIQREKRMEVSQVDFPLNLKFKSNPIKDFRVYVFAGMKYSYDLSAKSKKRNAEDLVKLNKHDIGANYGLGFEFNLPYFVFCPEFKVTNGILNMHSKDDALIYSNTIDKILNRTFTISLIFEG